MDNFVIKLKKVKPDTTAKGDYYTDKTLGNFPAKIKKIHENVNLRDIYKPEAENVITLFKGTENG
jgi:hypothetical protein